MKLERQALIGIGASPGVAIGPVTVYDRRSVPVPRRRLREDEVEDEVARLEKGIEDARREVEEVRDGLPEDAGADHRLLLETEALGVKPPIANLSATFGATIGQNGCAGIYPAMLATMIAPTMGVDPLSFSFITGLVAIVAVSSFGIAGVGGGATFAALVVLPAMGFPVTVAALLISIEPLIDMARTALNVNGAMTTGVITNRVLGEDLEEAAVPQTG